MSSFRERMNGPPVGRKFEHAPVVFPEVEAIMTPAGRKYLTPNGDYYTSVTTALKTLSAPAIAKWRARVGDKEADKISSQASGRGNDLHLLCEDYVHDRLDLDNKLPMSRELFKQIRPTLDRNLGTIYNTEFGLYSDRLRTAGRCDMLADWADLGPTTCDYKSSSKPKQEEWCLGYFIQCTTYSLITMEHTNLRPQHFAVLIAVEGSVEPQVFVRKVKDYLPLTIEFWKRYHTGHFDSGDFDQNWWKAYI